MSHLIAHGRAVTRNAQPNDTWGPEEHTLGHAYLTDTGALQILIEAPSGEPEHDLEITFPPNSLEAKVVKRIRGGSPR